MSNRPAEALRASVGESAGTSAPDASLQCAAGNLQPPLRGVGTVLRSNHSMASASPPVGSPPAPQSPRSGSAPYPRGAQLDPLADRPARRRGLWGRALRLLSSGRSGAAAATPACVSASLLRDGVDPRVAAVLLEQLDCFPVAISSALSEGLFSLGMAQLGRFSCGDFNCGARHWARKTPSGSPLGATAKVECRCNPRPLVATPRPSH